jgi:hypothetical protein
VSDDYLWDRSGPEDPDVARLEQLLAPLGRDAPLAKKRRRWPIVVGAVLAAAAAIVVFVATRSHEPQCTSSGAGFSFHGRGGDVACGGHELASGVLPVGGTLSTGAREADLAIADIGTAELGTNTEVRLVRTDATRHQLVLDRGHLHARVNAPPRLFAVATHSATVTDLGCEYTLDADARGAGTLLVQSGKVELATPRGAIVVALAGTRTTLLSGRRPGLPVRMDAASALVAAVHAYEHGEPGAAARVRAAATADDAVTLDELAAVEKESVRDETELDPIDD